MISDKKRQIFNNVPISGRTLNNYVLVKVDLTEKQRSRSGLFLGDASWDEAGHVTRSGIVISVPSKLLYSKVDKVGSEWLTDIEVECGNHVFWGIMSAYDSPAIKNGDDVYFLIKYTDLICKKIGEDLVPLNGYLICEKVIEELKSASFSLGVKHHRNKGKVKYVGTPNKEYAYDMCDGLDVKVGDTAITLSTMFTDLEDERYAILPTNLGYFQRRWVVMIERHEDNC